MKEQILAGIFTVLLFSGMTGSPANAQSGIDLRHLSSSKHGDYLTSAAEIVAYDARSKKLFVVNAQAVRLDILDISNPAAPVNIGSINAKVFGGVANSVAIFQGIVAAAIEDTVKQRPGTVAFYNTDGRLLSSVTVGAQPDMVVFTPDGKWVLAANEGEPNPDYTNDPEGSVSIIDMSPGAANITQGNVRTAGFTAFNNGSFDSRIRVFGPNATPAQDFEPEYIAVSEDSKTAWVVLQEANALAVVDIQAGAVTELLALGYKDHGLAGNGFDASNEDDKINIRSWPVKGMYQPDAIAAYRANNNTYLVTANEGDSRDYPGFSEETRIGSLTLDPTVFPNAADLQAPAALGRLKTTTTLGDTDGDGDYDELFSYGARSFSIWSTTGDLVYDSGDAIEQMLAIALPDEFNSNSETNDSFDDRSDDKGPEPEGLVIGEIDGKTIVFIVLERIGGVVTYDISDPNNPSFIQYINNRDFSGDAVQGAAQDLGPEGLVFISAADSPNGMSLLVVANEISGTTSIFEVGTITSVADGDTDEARIPNGITLHPNYPNPFNPSTTISFSLPKDSNVKIRVVDLTGRTVATLADSRYNAGEHSLQFQANNLASGSYFYTLEINGAVRQMRKLTLLK